MVCVNRNAIHNRANVKGRTRCNRIQQTCTFSRQGMYVRGPRRVSFKAPRPGTSGQQTCSSIWHMCRWSRRKYVEAEVWFSSLLVCGRGEEGPGGGLRLDYRSWRDFFVSSRGETWLCILGHRRLLSAQEKVYEGGGEHPETQRTREKLRIMKGADKTGPGLTAPGINLGIVILF